MTITHYITNPAELDRASLHELRQVVARYPYFQAARLLLLQNLFLLHDADFGEELRRAALLLPDRRVLFNMVEGDNYTPTEDQRAETQEGTAERTELLIDRFLQGTATAQTAPSGARRPATPIDAATDYTFFLETMADAPRTEPTNDEEQHKQELVEDFIDNPAPLKLPEEPEAAPEEEEEETRSEEEGFLTETLAKIYIKQGRYDKALEILYQINLNFPQKSPYFADQIRFLRKLVVNERYGTNENETRNTIKR